MIEQKAFRGKLWVAYGMAQFVQSMWEHFTIEACGNISPSITRGPD